MGELITPRIIVGRYALYDEIAAGGMATVHVARLLGHVGFSRTVAIKRLHPQFAKDPEFSAMFLDEARLAARIRHPNVVPTLDVVSVGHELFLVMEFVSGESLSRLLRTCAKKNVAPSAKVAATIVASVLHGLHAAHEAKSERGVPLGIVHRDVSPQNVLVGADGVPRVLDFGVAKAAHRAQTTRDGQVKGKLSYIAPEQLRSDTTDRRSDLFAASVVLWEAVTGKRLFEGDTQERVLTKILLDPIPSPRTHVPDIDPGLEAIVMKGLERDPAQRYPTAREMALALEAALPMATASEISAWVDEHAGPVIAQRAERVAEIETYSDTHDGPGSPTRPTSIPAPAAPLRTGAGASHVESEVTLDALELAEHQRKKKLKSTFLVWGSLGGAVSMVLLVTLVAVGGKSGPKVAGNAPAPAEASSATTSAATTTASAPPTTMRVDEPSPSAAPSAVASAAASAVAAAPRASSPKPPRGGCNPPFTVDKNGIRHAKPQCF